VQKKKIKPVKDKFEKLENEAKEVIKKLGSSPVKMTMEDLFSLFYEFFNDWKTAEIKMKKRKEEEKKRLSRKMNKQIKRKSRKKHLVNIERDSIGKIDQTLSDINGTNVCDMRKTLQKRRLQKQGHMTIRRRTMTIAQMRNSSSSKKVINNVHKGRDTPS